MEDSDPGSDGNEDNFTPNEADLAAADVVGDEDSDLDDDYEDDVVGDTGFEGDEDTDLSGIKAGGDSKAYKRMQNWLEKRYVQCFIVSKL